MDKKIVALGSLDRIKHVEGELVDKGVEVTVYRNPPPMDSFLTESLELRRERKKEVMANLNALEGEVEEDPNYKSEQLFGSLRQLVIADHDKRMKEIIQSKPIEGKVERVDPLQQYIEMMASVKPTFVLEIKPELPPIDGTFEQGPSTEFRKLLLPSGGIDVFALSAKARRLAPKPAIEGEFIKARDSDVGYHKIEDFDPHIVNDLKHSLQEIESAMRGEFVSKGVEVRVIPDHLVMPEPVAWPVHVSGPGIAAARHPADREPIEWDFFVEPGMQFTRGKERQKPIRSLGETETSRGVHKNFFDIWTAPKSDYFGNVGCEGPASFSFGEIIPGPKLNGSWYFMPLYWPDIKLLYSYLGLEEALRYGHGRWVCSG